MARSQHPIAPSHADQPEQPAGHLVLYRYRNAAQGDNSENFPVRTENLIRVDDVTESLKLVE